MNEWIVPTAEKVFLRDRAYIMESGSGKLRGVNVAAADEWVDKYLKLVPENLFVALKKEESHSISATRKLAYSNILCMPVQQSPWIAARVHPKVAPAYTNSTATLWELHFLCIYASDIVYESGSPKSRRAGELIVQLDSEIERAGKKMYDELQVDVFDPHAEKKISEANAIYKFIKKLEQFTIRLINLHEYYLWKVLIEGEEIKLPAAQFLTPNETPNATKVLISLAGDTTMWRMLIQSAQHMFHIRNEMYLKMREMKSGSRDFFGYTTLPQDTYAGMRDKGNVVYNGYLLFKTARLYFTMLNINYE